MINKESKKAFKDAKEKGFGLIDGKTLKRIDPEALVFIWDSNEKVKDMQKRVVLERDLMIVKKIFKEKFNDDNPYDLKLFRKDPGEFIERMIRAVEICTLNYVLNKGEGTLNKSKDSTIIKGKKKFVWES